jgi:hypothetical protein
MPGQCPLGPAHVLAQHPPASAIGQLTPVDQLPPNCRIRRSDQGTDVFQQNLINASATELGSPRVAST